MRPALGLAHLTVLELTPPEMVAVAGAVGFGSVGLRLQPVRPTDAVYPMHGDTPMMRETLARMADLGVGVLDLEVVRLVEETDVDMYLPMFEAGQRLGATRLLTLIDCKDDGRSAELVARTARLAAPFGLTVAVEFMPWFGVNRLDQAISIVTQAGESNVGLLIDSLHLSRSKASPADLKRVPPGMISYAQLCDAPAALPDTLEAIADEAKFARLYPGEGGLPLVDFVRALPADLPLTIEAPLGGERSKLPALERARLAFAAMHSVVQAADERR